MRDEEAQLMFANSFQYKFLVRNTRIVTILCAGKQQRYDELVLTQTTRLGYENPVTISIIKPFQNLSFNRGATIYFKGPLDVLK